MVPRGLEPRVLLILRERRWVEVIGFPKRKPKLKALRMANDSDKAPLKTPVAQSAGSSAKDP